MNKKEQNTVNMFQAVLAVLLMNTTITESVRVLAGYITKLQDLIGAILGKSEEVSSARTGKFEAKEVVRKSLTAVAVAVAGAIRAFASDREDAELKKKAKVSKSSLAVKSDIELSNQIGFILSLANEHKANLIDYGVSDADLRLLTGKKQAFDSSKSAVKTGIARGIGARKSRAQLISEARALIKDKIDGVIETLKDDSPEFYTSYHSARVIYDRPATFGSDKQPPPPEK